MRPLVPRSLATVASVALAAGLAAAPAGAAPSPAPQAPGVHYVALGDSFVSGPGIRPQRPEVPQCARSEKNFVSLVAAALKTTSFTDASCGGARTIDWTTSQGPGIPPQFDALKADTTLVTLGTMGGNDVGLVQLAGACLLQGCSTQSPEPYHEKIDALADVYRRAIAEVRRRSPRATIVAVGHGTYVPLTTCSALGAAKDADLAYLQGMIDRLSDTIEKVAREQRIAFVDMRDIAGWRDHTPCAAPADQWVRGFDAYDDGATLHPSTAGMTQMATQALAVIAPLVAPGPTPTPTPKPTSEQRVTAAAKTVKLRAVCSGPRRDRRVTLRVTGGQGLVRATSFYVGKSWLVVDRRAPFTVTRRAAPLRGAKARGTVSAKVGLRHGTATKLVTVRTARPGCLR